MLVLLLQQQPKEHCHGSRKTRRGSPIYMCHVPEDVLPCWPPANAHEPTCKGEDDECSQHMSVLKNLTFHRKVLSEDVD